MSGDPSLDLDAILAEFHSQEQAAPAPEPASAPRRRREAAPLAPDTAAEEGTALYVAGAGKHAAPQSESTPRRTAADLESVPAASRKEKREPLPENAVSARSRQAARPRPAAGSDASAEREARTAKARKRGKLHMAVVLAVLAVLLAGLLWWTIRTEREIAPEEPEPLRLELGAELEAYLEHAATTSHG